MFHVSAIIPAYNHVAYIRECVDSALNQTYPDVEVVVVDDGSTDGTYEILQTYGDRIRLLRQENRGTQAARNAAIRASTGEFIALLDSDDMWLPDKLEKQMAVFHEHPETALVYGLAAEIDERGEPIEEHILGEDMPDPDAAFESLLLGCRIPALTAIFPKSLVSQVGCFDEGLVGAGDWDMWLRLARLGPVRCVPEQVARYRVHLANTTKRLYGTGLAGAEDEAVLTRHLSALGDSAADGALASKARANVALRRAGYAAFQGSAAAAGDWLADAVELDATNGAAELLVARVAWCAFWAEPDEWRPRRAFAAAMLRTLARRGVLPPSVRATLQAEFAFGHACSLYSAGQRFALFEPVLTAVRWNSAYLHNGDVHAMLATAVLGPRLKSYASALLRRMGCFT